MQDELENLERDVRCAPCFTKEQKEVLHEVIRVYRGWQFVLKVAKGGTVVLGIIAGAIVSWNSIGEAIKQWLS